MTAASTLSNPTKTHPLLPSWRWLWSLPVLVVLGLIAFIVFRPILVLPRITLSPGYVLTDQDGARLTSEAMRGKIVLYNFTYTNCAGACESTTPFMQSIRSRLPELGDTPVPIEFVTISIDPEQDTPDVLRHYADQFGAGEDWHFLTGSPRRLKWVIGGGFGLFFERQDDDSLLLDKGIMLVDWSGTLRAEYRRTLPDADIVMRDLGLLLEELANNEGAARYAYEAAHLFSCYPR